MHSQPNVVVILFSNSLMAANIASCSVLLCSICWNCYILEKLSECKEVEDPWGQKWIHPSQRAELFNVLFWWQQGKQTLGQSEPLSHQIGNMKNRTSDYMLQMVLKGLFCLAGGRFPTQPTFPCILFLRQNTWI